MAHGEHYKPKPSLFPLYDAYVLFLYWNFVFLVSVLIVFFFSFDKVQVHAWPHTCTVHRVLWSATLLPLDLCLLTWCRNSKNLQLGTLFFSLTFTSAPSFIVQYLYVYLLPWTLFSIYFFSWKFMWAHIAQNPWSFIHSKSFYEWRIFRNMNMQNIANRNDFVCPARPFIRFN